jgi:hypothetical protein
MHFLVPVFEVHKSLRLVEADSPEEAERLAIPKGQEVSSRFHGLVSDYSRYMKDDTGKPEKVLIGEQPKLDEEPDKVEIRQEQKPKKIEKADTANVENKS